jgi:outer membrane protein assembly factor BamA
MRAGCGYNFQWYKVTNPKDAIPSTVIPGQDFFRNVFSLYYEYDSRDNVFTPHRGWHVRPAFETSIGFEDNDTYNKYTLDAGFYTPTFWKFVLVIHSYTGFIGRSFFSRNKWNPGKMVSDGDRFLLGSADTVRGYSKANSDGEWQWPEKGLCQQYFNIEMRFPIAEQLLWAQIFLDSGNMWRSAGLYNLNMKEYAYSTGIGFRVQIPMLPLRLYFSYKFGYSDETGLYIKNDKNKAGWYIPSFDLSVYGLF